MNKVAFELFGAGLLGGVLAVGLLLAMPILKDVGKDVREDVHKLHVQLDRLEDLLERDVRKDVAALKNQFENLVGCACKETDKCHCGSNNPAPEPDHHKLQWFQDSQNPNVFYYGFVGRDGVLYYYYYSVNGQVVKTGELSLKKTTNFVNNPKDNL